MSDSVLLIIFFVVIALALGSIFILINNAEKRRKEKFLEDEEKRIREAQKEKEAKEEMEWENRVRIISEPVLTIANLISGGDRFSFGYIDLPSGTDYILTDKKAEGIGGRVVCKKYLLQYMVSPYYATDSFSWMTADEAEYIYNIIDTCYDSQQKKIVEKETADKRKDMMDLYCPDLGNANRDSNDV